MIQKLKDIGRKLKKEAEFYRRVMRHKRTPRISKIFLGAAIGYLFLPFDLIPDFIPVIGHIDDAIIIPLFVFIAIKFIPKDVLAECRNNSY
jgi:uncharacterized membrane protein YkvA (DUF1232 family)